MRPYHADGAPMWGTFTVSLSVGAGAQVPSSPRVEFKVVNAQGPFVGAAYPFNGISQGQNEVRLLHPESTAEWGLLRFLCTAGAHQHNVRVEPTLFSLLVGVNKVMSSGQYLRGALNDVELMSTWTRWLQRHERDTVTICEALATAQNIVDNLRMLAARVHKGDTLLFYFSGLGTTSMVPQDCPELHIPERATTCLCPWDMFEKPLWRGNRKYNIVTSVDVMEALYPALLKGATVNLILDCSFSGVEDVPINWPGSEWPPEYVCEQFGYARRFKNLRLPDSVPEKWKAVANINDFATVVGIVNGLISDLEPQDRSLGTGGPQESISVGSVLDTLRVGAVQTAPSAAGAAGSARWVDISRGAQAFGTDIVEAAHRASATRDVARDAEAPAALEAMTRDRWVAVVRQAVELDPRGMCGVVDTAAGGLHASPERIARLMRDLSDSSLASILASSPASARRGWNEQEGSLALGSGGDQERLQRALRELPYRRKLELLDAQQTAAEQTADNSRTAEHKEVVSELLDGSGDDSVLCAEYVLSLLPDAKLCDILFGQATVPCTSVGISLEQEVRFYDALMCRASQTRWCAALGMMAKSHSGIKQRLGTSKHAGEIENETAALSNPQWLQLLEDVVNGDVVALQTVGDVLGRVVGRHVDTASISDAEGVGLAELVREVSDVGYSGVIAELSRRAPSATSAALVQAMTRGGDADRAAAEYALHGLDTVDSRGLLDLVSLGIKTLPHVLLPLISAATGRDVSEEATLDWANRANRGTEVKSVEGGLHESRSTVLALWDSPVSLRAVLHDSVVSGQLRDAQIQVVTPTTARAEAARARWLPADGDLGDLDSVHAFAAVRAVVDAFERVLRERAAGEGEGFMQELEALDEGRSGGPQASRGLRWQVGSRLLVDTRSRDVEQPQYSRGAGGLLFPVRACRGDRAGPVSTSRALEAVAHTAGYAVLDALRPAWADHIRDRPEGGVLHEAFADLAGLLVGLGASAVGGTAVAQTRCDVRAGGVARRQQPGVSDTLGTNAVLSACSTLTARDVWSPQTGLPRVAARRWSSRDLSAMVTSAVWSAVSSELARRCHGTTGDARPSRPGAAEDPSEVLSQLAKLALRALVTACLSEEFRDEAPTLVRFCDSLVKVVCHPIHNLQVGHHRVDDGNGPYCADDEYDGPDSGSDVEGSSNIGGEGSIGSEWLAGCYNDVPRKRARQSQGGRVTSVLTGEEMEASAILASFREPQQSTSEVCALEASPASHPLDSHRRGDDDSGSPDGDEGRDSDGDAGVSVGASGDDEDIKRVGGAAPQPPECGDDEDSGGEWLARSPPPAPGRDCVIDDKESNGGAGEAPRTPERADEDIGAEWSADTPPPTPGRDLVNNDANKGSQQTADAAPRTPEHSDEWVAAVPTMGHDCLNGDDNNDGQHPTDAPQRADEDIDGEWLAGAPTMRHEGLGDGEDCNGGHQTADAAQRADEDCGDEWLAGAPTTGHEDLDNGEENNDEQQTTDAAQRRDEDHDGEWLEGASTMGHDDPDNGEENSGQQTADATQHADQDIGSEWLAGAPKMGHEGLNDDEVTADTARRTPERNGDEAEPPLKRARLSEDEEEDGCEHSVARPWALGPDLSPLARALLGDIGSAPASDDDGGSSVGTSTGSDSSGTDRGGSGASRSSDVDSSSSDAEASSYSSSSSGSSYAEASSYSSGSSDSGSISSGSSGSSGSSSDSADSGSSDAEEASDSSGSGRW
eukprot:m51a1_g10385 hypothetical protein (1731) ;mRNA; f:78140-88176